MSTHVVKVPDIGEGIAEVELVLWHVRPGDTVVVDQVLADVMTDKATVEVPTPVAGRVLAVRGGVGDKRAVGSELLRIEVGAGALAAQGMSHGGSILAQSVPGAETTIQFRIPLPASPPAGDRPTPEPTALQGAA